ncbi:hypothetical protein VTO42DRAFT_2325 [Malbranchea cinnamomea]
MLLTFFEARSSCTCSCLGGRNPKLVNPRIAGTISRICASRASHRTFNQLQHFKLVLQQLSEVLICHFGINLGTHNSSVQSLKQQQGNGVREIKSVP